MTVACFVRASGMALLAIIYWYGASAYLIDPGVRAMSAPAAVAISITFIAGGWLAYDGLCRILGVAPRPRFAHGIEVAAGDGRWILGSYHVSQQNTFTGKLTEPMLDAVFERARALAWP